jgi:prefoldin subunit 5
VEQTSEKDDEPQVLLAEEELAAKEEPTLAPKAEQITEPAVVIPKYEPVSKEQPRYASRSEAFWISFGSSFLAFLMAIGLTLGALALINNGLRYVSPTQLGSVSRQVEGLNTQASILQQDLDGLRTRVDNLEGLSGRVSTIEQTTEQLRSDLDTASGQVEQLNQNVSILQTDFTELKNVSDRFQNFLDGLRELLNNEQQ